MAADLGVSARVRVLSATELATIIRENPLGKVASDPSRLLVTILTDPADRTRLRPLARRSWAPEAFAMGRLAAYTWCPAGLIRSAAATAAGKLLGDAATSRNWATMLKLQRLLDD